MQQQHKDTGKRCMSQAAILTMLTWVDLIIWIRVVCLWYGH